MFVLYRLDLCIYDPDLEQHDVINPLAYSFGWSKLETTLRKVGVHYQFNRILGYYRLEHLDVEIYLYLFGHSSRTKYWFDSIRRFGILYLQYEKLLELFDNQQQSANVNLLDNVNLLNRFQTYMINDMFIKVNIGNAVQLDKSCCYFSLPLDPYDMLANFYPNTWHKPNSICPAG